MYYNTAAYVGRAVGQVLASAERTLGRAPAVIVTGDHGESLFDEGFLGHGYALNEVQTRVPLIVRGLPVVIREPFGQVQLRDAIWAALSADVALSAPRIERPAGHALFQYLGTIERPRQVGYVDGTKYDFRTRAVAGPQHPWTPAAGLGADKPQPLLDLVWTWERMRAAREGR